MKEPCIEKCGDEILHRDLKANNLSYLFVDIIIDITQYLNTQ
jgi:hypothetical protein